MRVVCYNEDCPHFDTLVEVFGYEDATTGEWKWDPEACECGRPYDTDDDSVLLAIHGRHDFHRARREWMDRRARREH